MTKKKKLLIVTDAFYPHWTGISKSIYNLIRAIHTDFVITVLTVAHEKDLKKEETIFTARILREPYLLTISRSQYSLRIVAKLFSMVHQYDYVLLNSPSANIFLFALITKLFGKKLLIFHQGDLLLPKGISNRLIEVLFTIFSLLAFSLADEVSTYTKDYAQNSRVLKPFLHKFRSLLMPVYLAKGTNAKLPITKKKQQVFFGFGGRFVEEKGFDILFAAIPLIKQQLPNVTFLFAGAAHIAYENFFQKNKSAFAVVKDDIVLLGLLNDAELLAFYKMIDFMILPSRSDCFNLMQAEAMLAGTPCITSDIPGLRFMVKTTGFGVLFEKENPKDLAEKTVMAIAKRKEIMLQYSNVLAILEPQTNAAKIRDVITK